MARRADAAGRRSRHCGDRGEQRGRRSHGARVVLACRSAERALAAAARIRAEAPDADVELRELDLADLVSVRAFAEAFCRSHARLGALCNNAGVMAVPRRQTRDRFELQLGANHLGHVALGGPILRRGAGAAAVGGLRACDRRAARPGLE